MTKRTPAEKYQKLRESVLAEIQAAAENVHAEAEKTLRALSDPDLSPDDTLEIFKTLQAWPRIVLGLYRAELIIAKKDRKDKGAPEYGQEMPSEIARNVVAEAVDLGPDRVRELCKEGLRHLKQGMPSRVETTAAEFREMLSTPIPDNVAAEVKKIYSEQKEQSLSNLKERMRARKPLV